MWANEWEKRKSGILQGLERNFGILQGLKREYGKINNGPDFDAPNPWPIGFLSKEH